MMRTEDKTRMTEGSISRKIILFAIPLFLGNLFQQLYNTADSLIVGNYLGSNALAAVSSSGNLIFLMVGFINGDRKSTRLNSSHSGESRMPSSA